MIIGIMQGRLLPPVGDAIQEFPRDWKSEFVRLKGTGLCHVDWIVTKKSFKSNPLFKLDISLLPIRSVCADNLVDKNFFEPKFLKRYLEPICKTAVKNSIRSITIPLLEESDVSDDETRKKFIKAILPYSKKYKDLIFSFEFECEPEKIMEIAGTAKNFRITYDTGNVTSSAGKYAHSDYINKIFHLIDCVHLKDRTQSGKTKEPGGGDTPFTEIFTLLKQLKYDGSFTVQTARGKTGNEQNTIKKHFKFLTNIFLT